MEIWIIREGEKTGPFHDFEIRRKITAGELTPDTPAWHSGLAAWKPLVEIDLFSREFDLIAPPDDVPLAIPEAEPESDTPSLTPGSKPPPLPNEPAFIRRFWARWLDLSLYSGFWWLGMWASGQDINAALRNDWIQFFHYVPWFAIEAVLIQKFATTPGKWLCGMRVVNLDGTHLDLAASTRRSMRVLFSGIGFGFSYLAIFCQILSLVVSKRIGTTLWDATGGHQVTVAQSHTGRVLAVILAYAFAIALQWAVLLPDIATEAEKQNPESKEFLRRILPYSLPRRH